jgi:hypothetical protein
MVLLFNSFLTFVENLSVLERLKAHINIKEMFLQLFFRKEPAWHDKIRPQN